MNSANMHDKNCERFRADAIGTTCGCRERASPEFGSILLDTDTGPVLYTTEQRSSKVTPVCPHCGAKDTVGPCFGETAPKAGDTCPRCSGRGTITNPDGPGRMDCPNGCYYRPYVAPRTSDASSELKITEYGRPASAPDPLVDALLIAARRLCAKREGNDQPRAPQAAWVEMIDALNAYQRSLNDAPRTGEASRVSKDSEHWKRAHKFIYDRFDESGTDEDVYDLVLLLDEARDLGRASEAAQAEDHGGWRFKYGQLRDAVMGSPIIGDEGHEHVLSVAMRHALRSAEAPSREWLEGENEQLRTDLHKALAPAIECFLAGYDAGKQGGDPNDGWDIYFGRRKRRERDQPMEETCARSGTAPVAPKGPVKIAEPKRSPVGAAVSPAGSGTPSARDISGPDESDGGNSAVRSSGVAPNPFAKGQAYETASGFGTARSGPTPEDAFLTAYNLGYADGVNRKDWKGDEHWAIEARRSDQFTRPAKEKP